MRATLSAKILKSALKAVKAISETFESSKGEMLYGLNLTNDGLCLQSAGGLYVSYLLTTAVEGFENFVPVDISTLASLKFPNDEIEIRASKRALSAKSGPLELELTLPHSETAMTIKAKDLPTTYAFEVKPFLEALTFHTYGSHHNPVEAAKRLVRMFAKEGRLYLQSFDKQVSAFNHMAFAGELESDIHVIPKPITTVLSNITEQNVRFGVSKNFWRVKSDTIDVVYPNMIKPVGGNFEKVLQDIEQKPSVKISFSQEHLAKTLGVLSPSIKSGKEENPKMHFFIKEGQNIQVTVASDRIKSMKFELEGQLEPDRLAVDDIAIGLNFRYTREFVENLSGDVVRFQYWKYQDDDAPLKGRVLSFFNDNGRYLIGRLTL